MGWTNPPSALIPSAGGDTVEGCTKLHSLHNYQFAINSHTGSKRGGHEREKCDEKGLILKT